MAPSMSCPLSATGHQGVPITILCRRSHFQVTLRSRSPSRSVTLAVNGTPTFGCCDDKVTVPSSSTLVTMMVTARVAVSLVPAVLRRVGGHHRYVVYVVRTCVLRASRSWASLGASLKVRLPGVSGKMLNLPASAPCSDKTTVSPSSGSVAV